MILEVICGIFCGLSFRRGCREERGCSSGEKVKMVKKGHHDQHTTDSISSAINAQLTKSANKTCYSSDKYFRIRPICKIDLQHARKYCVVIFNLKCSQTHNVVNVTTTLQYKLEHSKYSQLLPQSTKTFMHLPIYRNKSPQPGNPHWIQNLDVSSPKYEIPVFPTQTPNIYTPPPPSQAQPTSTASAAPTTTPTPSIAPSKTPQRPSCSSESCRPRLGLTPPWSPGRHTPYTRPQRQPPRHDQTMLCVSL